MHFILLGERRERERERERERLNKHITMKHSIVCRKYLGDYILKFFKVDVIEGQI